MRIVISEIPIEIQKKSIKNMHLQVKPPDGHVVISAPLDMPDQAIEIYARTNLKWIQDSIRKFQDQPRSAKRQYISGETMYIWGKQYFISFVPDEQKNSFEIQGNRVILRMKKNSTVRQRESYVREQYRVMLKEQIERLLPKWEQRTNLRPDSWQTKYMVTRWGTCSMEKRKLWFNLQLAQKPMECLEYILLHELLHLKERRHSPAFVADMDRYMPNWREVRKELNRQKLDYYDAQDESPLRKLIDRRRYDELKSAAREYLCSKSDGEKNLEKATVSDIEIQKVSHIEQPQEGRIAFDVVACAELEWPASKTCKADFAEKWLTIHCQVLLGIELTEFEIVSIAECEQWGDADHNSSSGELVPVISEKDFDDEATEFLEKYYPLALREPVAVPIRRIAEDKLRLTIHEDARLSEEMDVVGLVAFEDCSISGEDKSIPVRNAKRGTMFIDPCVNGKSTLATANLAIAHECYHWYRHRPYDSLMKMIGADAKIGKYIRCTLEAAPCARDRWGVVDWMEWQANGVAPRILMPEKTARIKIERLLRTYRVSADKNVDAGRVDALVSELAAFYGLSKQAVKRRMREMGYAFGICDDENGKNAAASSFDRGALS